METLSEAGEQTVAKLTAFDHRLRSLLRAVPVLRIALSNPAEFPSGNLTAQLQ